MNEDLHTPDNYYISTDPKLRDHTWIVNSLLSSYWGSWRTHEIIHESIKNSICFGVYQKSDETFKHDRQVGFGRVVTDRVTFSWICDILIDPAHQKKGLGKFLLRTILAHPDVAKTVNLLRTKDAGAFYEKLGFEKTEAYRKIPAKDR